MNGAHLLGHDAILDCDVLVIGSGAGGATVADSLTAAGHDVVLVEEGPYIHHRTVPDSIPDGILKMWRAGGLTAGFGKPPISYVEGRCVGGGTEINSAIMQTVDDPILDDWARRFQIDDFSADVMRPYYQRAAQTISASFTQGDLGEASDMLLRGARALDWQAKPLERAQHHCVGTNLCTIGCPTGAKQSMSATAIPRALSRGMRLLAECRVKSIVLDGRRVTRVLTEARGHDGQMHKAEIRPKHVFLCAGAIHTPALLRRAGLTHNIGNTLRMHPTVKILAHFDRDIDAHRSRLPLYAVTEFMPDQRIGGSIFQPGFFGMAVAEDYQNRAWLLPEWRRCGIYYAMARSQAKGTIRTLPGCNEPLVRYALAPNDWRNLGAGLSHAARLMFAAGATHVYPAVAGHKGWTTPEDCDEFLEMPLPAARTNLMTIHLFSSCPPGRDEATSATDSFGRVHGVTNLTVADASIIPEAPGVNPQLTVIALAFRAAEAFLARTNRH